MPARHNLRRIDTTAFTTTTYERLADRRPEPSRLVDR